MAYQIITRQCTLCQIIKPLTDFYKQKDCKGGYRPDCKACCLKRIGTYQKTPGYKALRKPVAKRYQQSNKGKVAQKRYTQSKKGRKNRRINIANYRNRHPNRVRAHWAVKRAVISGKIEHPKNYKCHYCDNNAIQYHHYLGYEPKHWFDVVPICRDCHYKIHSLSN